MEQAAFCDMTTAIKLVLTILCWKSVCQGKVQLFPFFAQPQYTIVEYATQHTMMIVFASKVE